MELFGFGGRKRKKETVAILDVGSASAGGALVEFAPGANPAVLAAVRVPVKFLLDVDFGAFWNCARNSLRGVAKRLSEARPARADRAMCVFSSPWFVSQTRTAEVRKSEPFETDRELFESLADNEVGIFKRYWQSRAGRLRGEPEVLEREVMKVFLNGYGTGKPLGKTARELKAHLYVSLGIGRVKRDMKKDVLESFGDVPVSFHTLPFVVFSSLERIINPEWGYIFADIGGEVSDVSLVKGGVLEETVSFPMGFNFPARKAAAALKAPLDEAASMVRRFARGHASAGDARRLAPVIEEAKDKWRGFLKKALSELSDGGPLPRDFFLVGGTDPAGFAECAKEGFSSRFTVLGKPFKVRRISQEALKNHFEFRRSFEKDGDVFLMLEALFALNRVRSG